jgi:hypothetical protein
VNENVVCGVDVGLVEELEGAVGLLLQPAAMAASTSAVMQER